MQNQQGNKIASNLIKRKPRGRKTVSALLEWIDSQEVAELNKTVSEFINLKAPMIPE